MSEVQAALDEITGQWTTLLVTRICAASELEESVLNTQINGLAINAKIPQVKDALLKGLQIFTDYKPDQIELMSKATDTLLSKFSQNDHFPQIFATLFNNTHAIWSQRLIPPAGKEQKSKALHTDKIVNEEQLTKLEQLHCDVFIYLAKVFSEFSVTAKVNFDQIPLDIINDLYIYMNHDQPNAVRAAAGDILGSLSISARHCQTIIDKFWKQFTACKRDDDFRNFASWVDGVEKLQLSLSTPELTESAMHFLNSFISSQKKIERGVLRMKFLAALSVIIGRLNKSLTSNNPEYNKALNDIWNIAEKWSNKSKHVSFCYQFLCSLLQTSESSFYIIDHGKKFAELIKAQKVVEDYLLQITADYIEAAPVQLWQDKFPEWQVQMVEYIFPSFISGKEAKRVPKFTYPEQGKLAVRIIVEIGKKQMLPVIDYVRSILSISNPKGISPEIKTLRLVFIQALSELARVNPEALGKHNNELYPLLVPIFMGKSQGLPEELQYTITTFPLIHPLEEATCNEIVEKLFTYAIGEDEVLSSSSYLAVTQYIETVSTIDVSTKLPPKYIEQLLKSINLVETQKINHTLQYLFGIVNALCTSFTKCMEDYNKIKTGAAKITIAEWTQLRTSLDNTVFLLLVHPDKDIAQSARELVLVFTQPAFQQLDVLAFESSTYRTATWLKEEVPEGKDPLSFISILYDKNPEFVRTVYVNTLEFYKTNKSSLTAGIVTKLIHFMALVSIKEDETMKDFFNELYELLNKSPNNTDVIHSIQVLPVCAWSVFLTNFLVYSKVNGLEPPLFWTQFVNVHYGFSQRKEFVEQLEEIPSVKDSFRQFLIAFWKVPRESNTEEYSNNLKTFKVLSLYCTTAVDHLDTIIAEDEMPQFIQTILKMVDLKDREHFPTDYADSLLQSLAVICEFKQLQSVKTFQLFSKWLASFVQIYEQNETSQIKAVKVLTILLQYNTNILNEFFVGSYYKDPIYGSHCIVAMANVFEIHDDFLSTYENGDSIVLATILLHLKSQQPILRRAVHKLYGILLVKGKKIFTQDAPIPLIMELTSLTLSGSISQADQFIDFSSKSLSPKLIYKVFQIFEHDIANFGDKRQIIIILNNYLSLFVDQESFSDFTRLFLNIASHQQICEKNETADAMRSLWYRFSSLIKEKFADQIEDFIRFIFEYGMAEEDVSSEKLKVAIYALVYTFAEFPEEVADLLIPHLMFYDRHVPEDPNEFVRFLDKADINFVISKEEIFASNALSEIFLLLPTRELFIKIFSEKLAPLMYHALITYNEKCMDIGPFHHLLDTLLDAALFRFAENEKLFTSNLETLQTNNLIHSATSLQPQYTIQVSESGHLIAYDQEAIKAFTNLMVQADAGFPQKFYEIAIANAFQVNHDAERSNEPFMVIMALSDFMTSTQLYQLLLFCLYAFKKNKTVLVDSLIDNIRQHLTSKTIDDETFSEEVFPVIIVFILYLKLNLKQSLALHIIRNLADISSRVLEIDSKEKVSQQLQEFLQDFNNDEFVAALFIPYIQNLTTLGDQAVPNIINSLYQLAQLIGLSSSVYNWCLILAILLDVTRFMICEKSGRSQPAVIKMEGLEYTSYETVVSFLIEHFPEERQKFLIIEFVGAMFQNFKCLDLYKDNVVIGLLECYIRKADVVMNPGFTDKLVKLLSLISISCDESTQIAAASAQEFILSNLQIKVSSKNLALVHMKPKLIEVTYRPIFRTLAHKRFVVDPAQLPRFELFGLAKSIESEEVVKNMWDLIANKLK